MTPNRYTFIIFRLLAVLLAFLILYSTTFA